MKLKFTKLDYQQEAIKRIIDTLHGTHISDINDGQANPQLEFNYTNLSSIIIDIQNQEQLDKICGYTSVEENNGCLNLDIMMETGTGKTITFIETMYRLNQQYSLSKFIVVVPSSAIRSGTLKNIKITEDYFLEYDSKISVFDNNQVKEFIHASNENINVLITTFQAFNKTTNTIHQNKIEGNLYGNSMSYIEAIKKIRPVIIIDEPHRADGDKTQKALQQFQAPLMLRFGATFNEYKNLIYALDSATAFNDGLVKGINVISIGTNLKSSLTYLGNRQIRYQFDNRRDTQGISNNDDLGKIFNDASLDGYIVEGLTAANPKTIKFINGFELLLNEPSICDNLNQVVTRAMLQEAIKYHFQKEIILFKHNIKALSLFFIDNVDSYYKDKNKDGKLAKEFEQLYKVELQKMLNSSELTPEYRSYLEQVQTNISSVHGGYFAKSNSDKDNQEEIDTILRDKEKLLSFATPLRFIFSKWALREGWDNPNIFVLTKLSPSNSYITKLQQIGRGLRLAVDINGNRITKDHPSFENINELEVIVPSVESDFVKGIQDEILKNSIGKVMQFNNQDLLNNKICNTQRVANNLIATLEDYKIITANDEYHCVIECSQEYFNNQLSIIKEKHPEIDSAQLSKFIEQKFGGVSRIRTNVSREPLKTTINLDNFNKFKTLWAYINSKTQIKYNLDSDILIKNITAAINITLQVAELKIKIKRVNDAHDANKISTNNGSRDVVVPHKVTLKKLIEQLSLNTKLTQTTLIRILQNINPDKFNMVKTNFNQAVQQISEICITQIHKAMLQKITFDIIETNITNTAITDANSNIVADFNAYSLGKNKLELTDLPETVRDRAIFRDFMAYDSEIEKDTIKQSNDARIVVFAKLPKISIDTPIGKYNPDFAYVLQQQNNKQVFLVIETKGYDNDNEIPQKEQDKLSVAKKFFEALQNKYPQTKIHFEKKINKQQLSDIIDEVLQQ
jgi:type III restriction enzyme